MHTPEEVGPGGRRVEATEDVHHRRLAGPAGAHHRDEVSFPDHEIYAAQCLEGSLPAAVRLRDARELDERVAEGGGSRRGRHGCPSRLSVITGSPSFNALDETSVIRPLVAPTITETATGVPSLRAYTWRASPFPVAPFARLAVVAAGGCGTRLPTRPPPFSFFSGRDVAAGVKRNAALGTWRTSSRLAVVISAVAVMPVRKERSRLSTASTTRYETTFSLVCEP